MHTIYEGLIVDMVALISTSFFTLMINTFIFKSILLFLNVLTLKLTIIIIILPLDQPEIIFVTACTTKN